MKFNSKCVKNMYKLFAVSLTFLMVISCNRESAYSELEYGLEMSEKEKNRFAKDAISAYVFEISKEYPLEGFDAFVDEIFIQYLVFKEIREENNDE